MRTQLKIFTRTSNVNSFSSDMKSLEEEVDKWIYGKPYTTYKIKKVKINQTVIENDTLLTTLIVIYK